MANLPWTQEKRLRWYLDQTIKRSYRDDVLNRVEALRAAKLPGVTVEKYGALTINPEKYPLYAARVGNKPSLPTVLVTGGVHGYETSGVKGALLFLEEYASKYTDRYNFVIAPCISPWSWETINRLNPIMENPNREFIPEGKTEESRLLMAYLDSLGVTFAGHIDLHETTDSDLQFIPEEYSKNGKELSAGDMDIPDGFYLIGVEGFERTEVEKAMIGAVRKLTHIAKADAKGTLLDIPVSHEGMIHKVIRGLCAEYTDAKSKLGAFTTEMYPDSKSFKHLSTAEVEELCSNVQVACVGAALDTWAK